MNPAMFKLRRPQRSLFLLLPFSQTTPFSHSSYSPNPHLLHVHLLKRGPQLDFTITTDLLLAYFRNQDISSAQSLFTSLFGNDTRLLNYHIKQVSIAGFHEKIVSLYHFIRISGLKPDTFTFPYVLKACIKLSTLGEGEFIHTHILKFGFGSNVFVANSLINLYSNFGFVASARKLFDCMPDRNLVSWNLIISCNALNGFLENALELCSFMRYEKLMLDLVGIKIVLPICGQLGALKLGRTIHGIMTASGLCEDMVLGTAVMDMYFKCGELNFAQRIFCDLPIKDVVSWNAIICGYSQIGKLDVAFKYFHKMLLKGIRPSVVTVIIMLQTCADSTVLSSGEIIHGYIIKLGLTVDLDVETLLIDMYAKCGKLISACWVSKEISGGSVSSWTSIIHGLGMHGFGEAALLCFFQMLKRGLVPDEVCFLVILSSCSHTGLVIQGQKVFDYMVRHFRIEPNMEHYVCMVDLYGRAGLMEEAFDFIHMMPIEPDISVMGAFLGACKIHGKLAMGAVFGQRLVELGPTTSGYYKLLLCVYAEKGCWDEVFKIRRMMERRVEQKSSGSSLIAMNG